MAARSELTLEIKSRLKSAIAELEAVETAIDEVGDEADETGKKLDALQSDFEEMGGTAKKTAVAVAAGFTATTAAFASFETQTVNVQNITEATSAEMAALAGRIMELPAPLGEADDLMAGLYQTISSGITDPAAAFGVIVASAKAAKGNLADMTETVDAGTSILNAYNLEASEITNVLDSMTKTVDLGKLTFSELSANIGKGIAIAAAADVSYQELLTTLATLTLNGLSVEESMTAIRNILRVAVKPTKEESDAMADLGVDLSLSALQAEGFGKWMGRAADAVKDNAAATASLFPNMRALTGAMQLATKEGGEKWIENLEGVNSALGKSERNYQRMSETITGQTSALTAEFKKLGIEFGELTSEDVGDLISGLTNVIGVIRELDPEAKELVITAGEMAAVWAASVLVMPKLIAGYKTLSLAIAGTGAASATALTTVGKFNLAMAGATAVGLGLAAALDKVNQEFLRSGGIGSGRAFNQEAQDIENFQQALKDLHNTVTEGAEIFGHDSVVLAHNRDSILENLKAIKAETEAMVAAGTAKQSTIDYDEEIGEKIAALGRVMKKAAKIEKERLKLLKATVDALEDDTAATGDNTDAKNDNLGTTEALTEAEKELEEQLAKKNKKLDKEIEATDKLIGTSTALQMILPSIGAAMGLVAEGTAGATVWMRSLDEQIEDLDAGNLNDIAEGADYVAVEAHEAQQLVEAFFEALGTDIEPPDFADWRDEINKISTYFTQSLGFAIIDGLTEFENFGDFFEGLIDDWASMITDVIGGALSEAFETGDFGALGGNLAAGLQDLGLAGAVGGLAMVYQAAQMMDQTAATIQGIIGGAQVGGQAGGWIGAIIGGIIGGGAAFLGSEAAAPPTTTVSRIGAAGIGLRGTGQGPIAAEELDRIERQLNAAFDQIKVGYFDLLQTFEDPELFDLIERVASEIPILFPGGETFEGTIDEVIQWLVGGIVPEHIEDVFRDALSAGFAGLNVQQSVIDTLFGELDQMTGDDRFRALETFVRAVVNNAKLLTAMDWDEVVRTAGLDARESFVETIQGITEAAEVQFGGFDLLSLTEQAAQAIEIQDLIAQSGQLQLQYMTQILQLAEDIERSISGQIEALELGGLDPGGQADLIIGQINAIFEALSAGDLDPATIAQLTADAQNYIGLFQSLFGDLDLTLGEILDSFTVDESQVEGFEGFVEALAANADILEGLDWDSIVEAATIDQRTAFVNSMRGMLDEAAILLEGLETPEDALAIQDLINQSGQLQLQYLTQILQLSEEIGRSIGRQIEALQLGGMDDVEQAEFIGGQLSDLFAALGEDDLDPAAISQLTGDAQAYISSLTSMFGEDLDLDLADIPGLRDLVGELFESGVFAGLDIEELGLTGTGREFLIALLEILNTQSQEAIQENIDEVQALHKEEIDLLTQLNDALRGLTETVGLVGDGAVTDAEIDAEADFLEMLAALGIDLDLGATGREILIALLGSLNLAAQEAIQENIDQIQALNEEQIAILERLNAALTGLTLTVEGLIPGLETEVGGDDVSDFNLDAPGGEVGGGGGIPGGTREGPGGDDPIDLPGDDPFDFGDIGKSGVLQITNAIDRLANAIRTMEHPKTLVQVNPNLAGFVKLIKSTVGNMRFNFGTQTS